MWGRSVLPLCGVLVLGNGAAGSSATAENQPGHRAENYRDQNCPGGGHARGTDAARAKRTKATAKTEPRSTLSCGLHQRRLRMGFAGDNAVRLYGRDECLSGLGQLDQMHPARHVTVGHACRSELLRAAQRRGSRWYDEPELADVTAQAPREFLHVAGALRQWRVLVEHERHRLCRGHRLISLHVSQPHGEVTPLALVIAVTGFPMQDQREAHDTTPVWIKPS